MVGNEGFGQKLRAAMGAENYMGCLGKLQGLFFQKWQRSTNLEAKPLQNPRLRLCLIQREEGQQSGCFIEAPPKGFYFSGP